MAARSVRAWITLILPIAGLGLLPLVGIVYASTASFAPTPAEASSAKTSSSTARFPTIEEMTDPESPATPRKNTPAIGHVSRSSPLAPKPTKSKSKDAAQQACCQKLGDMVRGAETTHIAILSGAIAACNAANGAAPAFRQVASVLDGTNIEIPAECQK